MRIQNAKKIACDWVVEQGGKTPGYVGAFFHGSVNWLSDDAVLAPTSDLDIMLVLEDAEPPVKPGKFCYRGVMLEASYLSVDAVQSPQQVLGEYNLAGSFHTPSVIADPTGRLVPLQQAVEAEYANEEWVRARAWQACNKVVNTLANLDESAPYHEQVMRWLFGTGIMTHVLLAAGLRNPTVRLRYTAVRNLLEVYGRLDVHEELLDALGCAQIRPVQVEAHLQAMTSAFDAAKDVTATPFFFASDISDLARPIAIDGSWQLIKQGLHREAVFWIVATFSRCMMIFQADAPHLLNQHQAAYRALVYDLGIDSFEDMRVRSNHTIEMLPALWQAAEGIISVNPGVVSKESPSGM